MVRAENTARERQMIALVHSWHRKLKRFLMVLAGEVAILWHKGNAAHTYISLLYFEMPRNTFKHVNHARSYGMPTMSNTHYHIPIFERITSVHIVHTEHHMF